MGLELSKEDIRYDKKANRVIISIAGEEIILTPQIIREILPVMDEKEKAKDLAMMIHDINREKLARMEFFVTKMKELEKGIQDAREELKKCGKIVCIKKWQAVVKSYVDEKNALAEIRRTIGLLEKDKKPLRTRIARLGFDPKELTGEDQ